ncbi:tRNA (N6-threonylcarbamoyladenosine(37)-N6)-methyltransferase TrmO [Actinobacillus delphinicola]|uniref:tRNA (N6-threonylcarbamoyladenosine(37)-N6)-methyltransferase TrmO n=1 Tax=Actinobacillus delphinicola TaxID=51161 RepID=UPI002443277A|nr:tRNA (N6-threonylcarbamoyladenosine(37)-N6)-methyltransferase TrmO [Actinobacillus delphinicola]MDG6897709.1 tRNA (N6-threonylcarbamoyladenosine(37)-N6)-methyltransferase TrmO [Actinobacillus delphinicola]
MNDKLILNTVAIIHTPYKEKFAVPRQPDLVRDGKGRIELLPPYNTPEAVRGLEEFSHLWLIFQFNHIVTGKWQPTVRPPRLGGNKRVGVFASRATHRPNPLGLSKVALERIVCEQGTVFLEVGAVDLVDGTPILDIKPYLAYADSEPNAKSSFAQEKPQPRLDVIFTDLALQQAQEISRRIPNFIRFINDVLAQDPRPAYHKDKRQDRVYGVDLYDFNIRWHVIFQETPEKSEEFIEILSIEPK